MTENTIIFGGVTLNVTKREEIQVEFDCTETVLHDGKTVIDASTNTRFGRTYECYTDNFSVITSLLAFIGLPKTLVIDSTSYTNCYITSPFSYKEVILGSGKYTYKITFKRQTA